MKRVIIIVSIISFMLILSTVGVLYLRHASKTMYSFIDECSMHIINMDYINANKIIDDAIMSWQGYENMLMLYIKHDDLGQISRELSLAKENLLLENYQEVYLILSDLQYVIKHIYQTEVPTIENIF